MIFIWFNPDTDSYEKGSIRDYDKKILTSQNNDRFDLLYEFNYTTVRLADKILDALNLVRQQYRDTLAIQ